MANITQQDPSAQLRWLVDRALITDHFLAFARAVDDKDQAAYAGLFAEDGRVALPHGTFEGQAAIRAMRGPPPHWGTHHIQGNHQIEIDGDQATARAYVIASHAFNREVPGENARAGGWYDADLIRGPTGWLFQSVALTIVWNTGQMIPNARPPA